MIHTIQPISIPKEMGLRRMLVSPYDRDGLLITEDGQAGYDHSTIFYDVFHSVKLNRLVAIGPPLLNFKDELFPLTVTVDGNPVTYRLEERFPKVFWLIVELNLADEDEWELGFNFNGIIRHSVAVKRERFHIESALVTMQKNETYRHINDWIEHYRRCYEVDSVFIYDNNTPDFEELSSNFPDVNFIRWNFPFGIIRSQPNKFAQRGALNHFLYRFSSRTRIFQFDIDELAFVNFPIRPKKNYYLKDFIITQSADVPEVNSFEDYEGVDVRCRDLRRYKFRKPNKRHHNKYICLSESVEHLEVHYFTLAGSRGIRKVVRIFWGMWKRLKRLEWLIQAFVFIFTWGHVHFIGYRGGRFNHYKGMTTRWRK